jgi:O-succinylbenzoic acid--CoA ligase
MRERQDEVPDPLALRGQATPDRIALLVAGTDEHFDYRTLDDAAAAVAAWLESDLDAANPTVGLMLDRHPAVAPLCFGGLRAGARIGLLDVNVPPRGLTARIERLDCDVVVCEADSLGVAAGSTRIACVDPPDDTDVSHLDPFATATAEADRPASRTALDSGELVAFTSGTTGDPKAVRLDLEGLVASAVASALRLGVAADDRWLVPIPTYHVGGLSPVVRCTQAGTTAVLQPAFDAGETAAAIESHDVTCVSLVPTQLSRLLEDGWDPPDRLRLVLLGGGPIPRTLIERCAERDVPVCPTYGTTETASQVATARPAEAYTHPGTVGRPLPFTDVSIVDDGDPCDPEAVGEVVVDGPTVTPGYLDDHRTSAAFGDRGFHTGDLGYIDDEGQLWIEGRVDDRVVTGGEVVSASSVADAIHSVDGVEDVAVVGLDDPEWGERVAALVVAGGDPTVEIVREACRQRLPEYAVPKTVAFTDRLPRTPSGTVDRSLVEAELE